MRSRLSLLLGGIACGGVWLSPGVAKAVPVFEIHYVMGTYLRIDVDAADGDTARRAMRRCFSEVRHAEERFTRFDAQSELSKLNRDSAIALTPSVSTDMRALLERAVDLRRRTAGDFDVTAGALTTLWRQAKQWPSAAAIVLARGSVGADALSVSNGEVHLRRGTIIDLDGIAKGWAVDQCAASLQEEGIAAAVLSFGESSVRSFGSSSELSRTLTVRGLHDGESIGEVDIGDASISVSAVFGHEREIAGRRTGHIIDPQNGQPLGKPAVALAVADSATDAEAFSKALLIEAARGKDWHVPHMKGLRGGIVVTETSIRHFGKVSFRVASRQLAPASEPLR